VIASIDHPGVVIKHTGVIEGEHARPALARAAR
jgi:hypothetical protein